jgi:hypothetical protein
MRPPADLPRGECIMTSLPDGSIRIDQADPRILISAELLDAIAAAPTRNTWLDRTGGPHLQDALLKIHGVNRTVTYRIVDYVPSVKGYIGQWPD